MMKLSTIFKTMTVGVMLTLSSTAIAAEPSIVPDGPSIAAKGYVLMDFNSGKVLASKNAEVQLPPASLTKIMTSYVIGQSVAQGNISLDDTVLISKNAWSTNFPDSSKMFIEVGTKVKVADLNRGIIIQSGNDACVAMAEHIAGSEDAFVDLMNAWAKELGLKHTHFANVHGLDHSELYTTPMDMATLAQALIRDVPEEYAIYREKEFTFNGIKQYNRNSLLWDTSMNVDGMKTGHTNKAGYSLVSSATEGSMRLIAVVMGTEDATARKTESKKLLNYGFRFFSTVSPHKAGATLTTERVWMGDTDKISLGLEKDSYVTLPRGQIQGLTTSFKLEKELIAPVQKGDVVGTLYYQVDGKDVAQYPLVALNTVEKGGFFSRLIDYILMLIQSWF